MRSRRFNRAVELQVKGCARARKICLAVIIFFHADLILIERILRWRICMRNSEVRNNAMPARRDNIAFPLDGAWKVSTLTTAHSRCARAKSRRDVPTIARARAPSRLTSIACEPSRNHDRRNERCRGAVCRCSPRARRHSRLRARARARPLHVR